MFPKILALALLLVGSIADKVGVEWYGASWGSDCDNFAETLTKTLAAEGLADIVDFSFFPVGGFSRGGKVTCPVGGSDKDCNMDKIEACVLAVRLAIRCVYGCACVVILSLSLLRFPSQLR